MSAEDYFYDIDFGYTDEEYEQPYDEVVTTTDKAWQIRCGDEVAWIPKSPCELRREDKIVLIPMWLCIDWKPILRKL
jgi:hypothetical protein